MQPDVVPSLEKALAKQHSAAIAFLPAFVPGITYAPDPLFGRLLFRTGDHGGSGAHREVRTSFPEMDALRKSSRIETMPPRADPLGEDPLCAYQPGGFPYQRELSEMPAHNRGRGEHP